MLKLLAILHIQACSTPFMQMLFDAIHQKKTGCNDCQTVVAQKTLCHLVMITDSSKRVSFCSIHCQPSRKHHATRESAKLRDGSGRGSHGGGGGMGGGGGGRQSNTCDELAARLWQQGLQCPLSDEGVRSRSCALYGCSPVSCCRYQQLSAAVLLWHASGKLVSPVLLPKDANSLYCCSLLLQIKTKQDEHKH